MNVAVSGASGFVGRAVTAALRGGGDSVVPLVRDARSGIRWDPAARSIDRAARAALAATDAVVHLSGESILGRWTAAKRAAIRASRVDSTRFLAETLASLARGPRTLVVASAIGYYGDRGEAVVDETTGPGPGFLAAVCVDWEAAADAARAAGIRVVHLRTGLPLARDGGVLGAQLLPFRLGLGGPIGTGRQWWSWIARDDLAALYCHAVRDAAMAGPVNAVAPHPVTNRAFARALGHVLRRPAFLPLPPAALRLVFGGDATRELFLAGARVRPIQALAAGFRFRWPDLDSALRNALAAGA